MFSKTQTYSFSGSDVDVHLHEPARISPIHEMETVSLAEHIRVPDGDIYLGHFVHHMSVVWGSDRIENGCAVFEYGRVDFPNFREVRVWIKEPPLWKVHRLAI